jgi:hypothetical protein
VAKAATPPFGSKVERMKKKFSLPTTKKRTKKKGESEEGDEEFAHLKSSHTLLKDIVGWVHDAGVDVAELLEAKQIGGCDRMNKKKKCRKFNQSRPSRKKKNELLQR